MNKTLIWIRNNWFNLLIISIYTSLICFCTYFHEPWRDEAQSWLIVRDLDIGGVLRQMSYEGTPALWHILIFPLAKLGLPYFSQSILHLLIAVSAASILMFYAPFKKLIKILIVFSYYFIYEYAVIARNYNIGILLLFLIAALYRDRFKKPVIYASLVFLLFNTNVLNLTAASTIMMLWIWDAVKQKKFNAKFYWSILIMFTGAISVLLQLLPRSDSGLAALIRFFYPDAFSIAIGQAFFPWATTSICLTIAALLSLYLLLGLILFYLSRPATIFMILSLSWLFYIFTFKYHCFERHFGLLLIFLIFALWISRADNPSKPKNEDHKILDKIFLIICCLILFLSCIYSLKIFWDEYNYPFSGSRDMANFIVQNNLENKIIVAYNAAEASPILLYLPKVKFWYPERGYFGTFITWDKVHFANNYLSQDQIFKIIWTKFIDKKNIIILLIEPLDKAYSQNYILLHHSSNNDFWPGGACNESYWLYQYKSEQ